MNPKLFSKAIPIVFLIGLSWWLFPVNINQSHDWGGDFSQYISQAINIAEQQPIHSSSFIRNPDYLVIGPITYPNGFPLLLSPIYKLYGNQVAAFLGLIAGFYIIYFFLSYFLLDKHFNSKWTALLLVSVMIINPPLIAFKAEIVSDIPFSCFFLGSFLLLFCAENREKYNWYLLMLAGVLAAFSIFTRSMGLVLLLAFPLYKLFQKESFKSRLIQISSFLVPTVVSWFVLSFLFPSHSEYDYLKMFTEGSLLNSVFNHSAQYARMLRDIIPVYHTNAGLLSIIISAFVFVFFLLGIYQDLKTKRSLLFWVVSIYWIVGFIHSSSIYWRFFIPILPFILIYARKGISMLWTNQPELKKISVVLLLITFYLNALHTNRVRKSNRVIEGPQSAESIEAFSFLKNNCQSEETVNFIKPRVLALYTHLKTYSNNPKGKQEGLSNKWDENNVKWLVQHSVLSNPALDQYIENNKDQLELVFQNSKFIIYKR